MVLQRLIRPGFKKEVGRAYAVPPGERIYTIGDIHGRLDLLNDLLERIEKDDAARDVAKTTLVFLGDLVDRGPDSRGVVERVMQLKRKDPSIVLLKGNHEEIMINAYRGDKAVAALFNRVGGRATLLSYGISEEAYDSASLSELIELIRSHVPKDHIAFLDNFGDWHAAGDYLFVHAGIRPGVELEKQAVSDLRWIRREFLSYEGDHGKMVVHGHTITEQVDERPNRIGIDTGAFFSGRLSALCLEGGMRTYLEARE